MTAPVLTSPRAGTTQVSHTSLAAGDVWRPVQYLGSKLRAINAILDVATELSPVGALWDAFSGSSVVSQAAARRGYDVFATDTQAFATTFASAMLSTGASDEAAETLPRLVEELVAAPHPDDQFWAPFRREEENLLRAQDYDGLVEFYGTLPQRWRGPARQWNAHTPLTSTYAGTYLSLDQAMTLDAARLHIREMRANNADRQWLSAATLTALSHAASEAVHSAGKHFAQPIQPANADSSNYPFVRSRALKDRSVSIREKAIAGARNISKRNPLGGVHEAQNLDALGVTADDLATRGVTVVYGDPPYTAQQYSRFYHVLETLHSGVAEPLQSVRGRTPKGLYPEDRYLSPFCSKRQVGPAFRQFVRTARAAGAHLVLSYSTTGDNSGNGRTIGTDDLVAIVQESYGVGGVTLLPLGFGYRQFNHDSRRMETVGTGEVLIIGEAK